ncbi:MAG: DUF3024 domain-containing protein [Burkholderiales bacterium]|nr:DUF3024 domain-containing protein [Burkholderiales bacterium]
MDNCPHPNEIDLRRIERRLSDRCRYRYVSPQVSAIPNGYEIRSPCCSRNIDKSGGMIDIARIEFVPQKRTWRLYSKEHEGGIWRFHAEYPNLPELLKAINEDPERRFWQ